LAVGTCEIPDAASRNRSVGKSEGRRHFLFRETVLVGQFALGQDHRAESHGPPEVVVFPEEDEHDLHFVGLVSQGGRVFVQECEPCEVAL
jgi:hypothetical protein